MTRRRRLVGLVLAFVVAGCSGQPPTAAPVVPSATPAAVASPSPAPTPPATPEPTRGCPAEPIEIDTALDLLTAQGHLSIELQPGTLEPPEPVDAAIVPVETTLVGGATPTATVQDDLNVGAATIDAITLEFVPFNTTTVMPLAATTDGTTVSFDLPDQDISGRLRVAASWTTTCASGAGIGEIGLTIVNSSVVAGCPTVDEGIGDEVAALQAEHVTVGTAELPFTVVAANARWFAGFIDSLVPQFSGWDRDISTVVAPGTSLLLKKSIDDLAAKTIRTTIYKRADVIEYLSPDSTIDLRSVSISNRAPGPKGNVGLQVPDAVGSYVYELQGQWQTSCVDVETYMVVSVEVR